MGIYLYRTENVQIATDPTTYTHALGVAPAGDDGAVFITMRTSTGHVRPTASNSQIVVLTSSVANAAVDLVVQRFHSIVK